MEDGMNIYEIRIKRFIRKGKEYFKFLNIYLHTIQEKAINDNKTKVQEIGKRRD